MNKRSSHISGVRRLIHRITSTSPIPIHPQPHHAQLLLKLLLLRLLLAGFAHYALDLLLKIRIEIGMHKAGGIRGRVVALGVDRLYLVHLLSLF